MLIKKVFKICKSLNLPMYSLHCVATSDLRASSARSHLLIHRITLFTPSSDKI